MIQCPYGHHYDDTLFDECPWCKRIDTWEKENRQESGSSNHTVFMFDENGVEDDDRTVLLMEDDEDDHYERTVLLYDDDDKEEKATDRQMIQPEKPVFSKQRQDEVTPELLTGWLVYVNGNKRGRAITLGQKDTLLGQDESGEVIVLEEEELLQAYAVVVYESDVREFYIKPGKKRCLFYAGDNAVYNRTSLKSGDMVEIGQSKMIFVPFCNETFDWDDDKEEGQ